MTFTTEERELLVEALAKLAADRDDRRRRYTAEESQEAEEAGLAAAKEAETIRTLSERITRER